MKNLEKKDEVKNSQDEKYSKSRFPTFNKNYSSEIQFIVPWVQYDKSNFQECKNLIINERH